MLVMGVALLVAGIAATHGSITNSVGVAIACTGWAFCRTAVQYKATPTYMVALALLLVGLVALASIIFQDAGLPWAWSAPTPQPIHASPHGLDGGRRVPDGLGASLSRGGAGPDAAGEGFWTMRNRHQSRLARFVRATAG
jgi:hypothetical protein